MLEFLAGYGLFLAKLVTILIGVAVVIGIAASLGGRHRRDAEQGHIEVKKLNDHYDEMEEKLQKAVLSEQDLKAVHKEKKRKQKADKKQSKTGDADVRQRLYVLNFEGDIEASSVDQLREEISAVLTLATNKDEVLVRLESMGGVVHGYGLAASQLQRIKNHGVPLTISIDKVAASGGYMMACIGDKLIAAPFAILGSVGVITQFTNFHRILKKNDVDVETMTAGEYKHTVSRLGEITEKARKKLQEELEDTHQLFKRFVSENRPLLNVDEIATGEVWYGLRAIDRKLIDEIQTSDEYLMSRYHDCDIFEVKLEAKKSIPEKMGLSIEKGADRLLVKWWGRLLKDRYY